jgi:hypothetical protein
MAKTKKTMGMPNNGMHNVKPLPLNEKSHSKQPDHQILPTFDKAVKQHKQLAGY